MGTKKIANTEIESSVEVNKLTGEIINENLKHKTKISVLETEPRYVKLYLDDLSLLNGLTQNQNNILLEIIKMTEFETNIVFLNKYNRERISKNIGSPDQTIKNCISDFSKKSILIKVATGVYKINPYLFGTGSWQKIKGLRLTIDYTEEGKTQKLEEIK